MRKLRGHGREGPIQHIPPEPRECSAHPELVEECAPEGVVLVVTDPLGDESDGA